jgi:cellulose biosynthesis protein BcsQ
MTGKVVTFYSFKGGVGRSFALANIAVILAQWGYRVLAVDWDIEAPGLHHYFSDYVSGLSAGILDFLSDCEQDAPYAWDRYANAAKVPDCDDHLFLMPAMGSGDQHYTDTVQALDWDVLYQEHHFGMHLENLRADWVANFDFVLIDSRTGVTDFSGVTTVQLPDILTFLFTANHQSLDGCRNIVRRAMEARRNLPLDRAALLPLPIVAKFDLTNAKNTIGRRFGARNLPIGWLNFIRFGRHPRSRFPD